jgi:hypothetical protein
MALQLCFKGLSQDGGQADSSKNSIAQLFNKYLSNKPAFSQIHLAGQYPIIWALLSDVESRENTVRRCLIIQARYKKFKNLAVPHFTFAICTRQWNRKFTFQHYVEQF